MSDEPIKRPRQPKPKAKETKRDPAEMTEAERALYDAQDREHWEASAAHIINSNDVLELFAREIGKVVAGEEHNAKLLYLIATSRVFRKTMHGAVKGTSSGGKSELRNHVLMFFPPEEVVSFTTLTEKALIYLPDSLSHKILSMGEAANDDEKSLQDSILRQFMSDGRLEHLVTEGGKGTAFVGKKIVKEGPITFLVTTTRNFLHPENETRMLSLEIDDSEKQTRAVLKKVAALEGLEIEEADIDYEPWRDYQRWLASGERRVIVPFADSLAEKIPPASVRLRRDFGQVLRAIKVHALLHRQWRDCDDQGRMVANIEHDYATIQPLMNALIAESSGVAVKPELQQTIEAVRLATEGLAADDGANAQAVGKLLKLDKSAARRRLLVAVSEGFVRNLETRKGQPGRYRLTGQQVEVAEMLPDPGSLTRAPLATVPPQPKSQVVANTKQSATGGTVAWVAGTGEGDGDRFASLKDARYGLQPRTDANPWADLDIPPELDRRQNRGAA